MLEDWENLNINKSLYIDLKDNLLPLMLVRAEIVIKDVLEGYRKEISEILKINNSSYQKINSELIRDIGFFKTKTQIRLNLNIEIFYYTLSEKREKELSIYFYQLVMRLMGELKKENLI